MTTVLSSTAPVSSQVLARGWMATMRSNCVSDSKRILRAHMSAGTRRRVLSDDDFPLTQVLPAFSHLRSKGGVVPGA